jgi:hypothetical protein
MMRVLWYGLCSAIISTFLGVAASADAAEMMKHSGSIFSVGDNATTFVLAEVVVWPARSGTTAITYRMITVTPETQFVIVGRDRETGSGFPGDFVETPLEADGFYVDDYVTIDCVHKGDRMIAVKITVTEVFPTAEP